MDIYVDEGSQDRMVVYVEGGQGRVELQSNYSSSGKDYWVIASQASRAEAISRGYILAGHLAWLCFEATTPRINLDNHGP